MSRPLRNPRAQRAQGARISAEQESLLARLAALKRASSLRERRDASGDNTPTSDTLDTVQETMAKEEDLAVRGAMIERLKVLARADEKIREGTYGMCEACGKPILRARLRALPEAVLCVACAEAEEHRPLRSR
jgi:RNA polymerase-binding transcription factor DksA